MPHDHRSAAGLATPTVPFPVDETYVVRSDLVRMPCHRHDLPQRGHFELDDQLPEYLGRKLDRLRDHPAHARARAIDCEDEAVAEVARRAFPVLAVEHPGWASVAGDSIQLIGLGLEVDRRDFRIVRDRPAPMAALGSRVRDHLEAIDRADRPLEALALAVQEDLVVVHSKGSVGRAERMVVCFPSGWDPANRIGQSFEQLHGPVPLSGRLIDAAPGLVAAMVGRGPFVRFVWGIGPTPDLGHNPTLDPAAVAGLDPDADPASWWFRAERQTTMPLPDLSRALFTIRVYVAPLAEALDAAPGRRDRLAKALASMDPALLAYKRLDRAGDRLLDYLTRGST